MNSITENLYYTHTNGSGKNQRLIMSALTEHPIAWKISKVENASPFGICKITLKQDMFNRHTDYVDIATGEMYADYYDSSILPFDEEDSSYNDIHIELFSKTNSIKIGGSYKEISAIVYDKNGNDVTTEFFSSHDDISWACYIDNADITESDFITWKHQENGNSVKLKLANDKKYLAKTITIKVRSGEYFGSIDMEIISL